MRFMQYRSTRKAVVSVKYHAIWCPKDRRRVLGGAAELRLKQIIGEVLAEFDGMVIEVETMPITCIYWSSCHRRWRSRSSLRL